LKGSDGVRAVKDAINAGYRLFDTAFLYGNEDIVGKGITEKINEGVIKRDEILIVGKLWGIHHEQVEKACRDTCKRLNVNYVDFYLLHFPVSFMYHGDEEKWPKDSSDCLDKDYMEVWREMEKLVGLGLTKAIGVSNFNSEQIKRLHENASIKPSCHEMEFHPAFCRDDLLKMCNDLKIHVLAFCPLGRHNPVKQKPEFLYNKRVEEIAKKYCKTTAQIALRFSIQSGAIPIPKSTSTMRIKENIDIFDFKLDDDEMKLLKSFHENENQICKFHFAEGNKYYPY
jgi:aldehyde reductase